MAVLRSVWEFAFKKVDKELKGLGKDESKDILEVLEEPISEIIEGLEEPHTELQQRWWKMKLSAVFLLQTQERNVCSRPMAGLPSISYDTYFDMVKAFNWFESIVEVPCSLETTERLNFYSKLTQHIQREPVTYLDLQLISSLIGHFLQLRFHDQPINYEENGIEFQELISKLMEITIQYSELLENLNGEVLSEFLNRILVLPVLYLEKSNLKFKKSDQNVEFFSNFCAKSNLNFSQLDISKFPCVLWIKCLKFVSKTLRAKSNVDFEEAMNKRFFKVNNFESKMESLCVEFLQIRGALFKNLSEEFSQDKDRLCDLVSSVFYKQQAFSKKEAKERKAVESSSDSCLRRIGTKSPGFEDDIENWLKLQDLHELDQKGYLDLFLKNPAVLFKEKYLYEILEIYQNSSQQNFTKETICKLRKLVCGVFRNLPLVLQQKFILHGYRENVNLQLLSEPEFNSELTVIFNKFTNNSTEQVLQDVMYLLLIDVETTMERLVDAVINNSGQIDTVIQILQSLPDLCKCRHTLNHPKTTLLVWSIKNVITKSRIEKQQEKNFLKFISAVSKDYRYQILQDKDCQEPSVLNIQEFVLICIIANLYKESLYTDTFSLPLEFTIKLFTTVLEATRDKPCDWLINLFPLCTLLHIGDVYNEVVQSLVEFEYFDTRMVIRQLIHKLLAAMKNPLRKWNFKVEEKHFDWFMYHIEEYDWRIKIALHKFITSFTVDGHESHTQYLKEIITCAIETGDVKLVLELGVINEEVTEMVLDNLHMLPVTQISLTIALIQVLPGLLPTEWSRLYKLVLLIIYHLNRFPLRLLFVEKVIPQHLPDVYVELGGIQFINDAVVVLTDRLPPDILQHVLRSYAGLVQFILCENCKEPPTESRALFFADLFSCLAITMTIVVREHQETLFVCLLDILAEVKKIDSVKCAMRETYYPALHKAVYIIKDGQMARTLSSRLDEILL
ncbi:hypothetical protein LOTGIDRAFT_230079 [Lottia gigantea]|uniref:Edg1 TPR repeats region domain-containing protein n=1 Tax=Lottia gigantea TaxID=225164 RepID=V4ALI4_LOTGI|nr:hypothetical protein LOTGIDRAFT_230079 [Lottia gigantea]ESP05044.1 hypothetical protein LOTGIDRAFT_230079 [Lottia gigantea]